VRLFRKLKDSLGDGILRLQRLRSRLPYGLIICVFLIIGVLCSPGVKGLWQLVCWALAWLVGIVLAHLYAHEMFLALQRQSEECEDVEEVGQLIQVMKLGRGRLVKLARNPLVRLLPKMRGEHRGLMTRSDRGWMHGVLQSNWYRSDYDEELVLAILEAQAYVATPAVVPLVVRLTEVGPSHAVRQTAKLVLPLVRICAESAHSARTLLRAAESPDDAEALLRPAVGTGEVDEAQLLRPSGLGG
jgi:hypothetical protein